MFFQYYSLVLFVISVMVMFVVSYMTEAPDYEKISGLTYGTLKTGHKKKLRQVRVLLM